MKNKCSKQELLKKYTVKLSVICFWILFWEILSRRIAQDIFLPSPYAVLTALFEAVRKPDFWQTVLYSSLHIVYGFLWALVIGIALAVAAYNIRILYELISPVMKIIKAIPVASFIILALLWVDKKNLSVLASFMMVVPLIYSNVVQGLRATDEKLLQMAKVFRISRLKKVIAIYIPAVLPYFISSVSVGIGLGWKAGIAAEVIGIPSGSIGEQLYEAKLYLMTKELFAWTIVIILISILFERAVMYLLRHLQKGSDKQKENTEF